MDHLRLVNPPKLQNQGLRGYYCPLEQIQDNEKGYWEAVNKSRQAGA